MGDPLDDPNGLFDIRTKMIGGLSTIEQSIEFCAKLRNVIKAPIVRFDLGGHLGLEIIGTLARNCVRHTEEGKLE